MRKLVSSFFISLDGVVEAPDKWHFPYFNDEMGAAVGEAIGASDACSSGAAVRGVRGVLAHQDPRRPVRLDHERHAEVRRLDDARTSTTGRTRPCSRVTSPTPSTSSRRSPARTSACRGAPRSCGRCSSRASSTSCGCSCTRSSSARARSCSPTARPRVARARRLEDLLDRRPRPDIPFRWPHERPPDRAVAGRHADRLRRRGRRAGAGARRRRVQLPPLQELAPARGAARAAVHGRQLRPARAWRQRRRRGVRGRARDRGPRGARRDDGRIRGRLRHVFRRRARPPGCRGGCPYRRAVVYQPPFTVDATGHLPPADFEQRLDELVASGDRGATVALLHAGGDGRATRLVSALRLARPIWRNLEAVSHTLPYDYAVMNGTVHGSHSHRSRGHRSRRRRSSSTAARARPRSATRRMRSRCTPAPRSAPSTGRATISR